MKIELKPCPLCGKEPELYISDFNTPYVRVSVICRECELHMENECKGDYKEIIKSQTDRWNRRTETRNAEKERSEA